MTANALAILTLDQRLDEITRKADKTARVMAHLFKLKASEDAGKARVSIQAQWLQWSHRLTADELAGFRYDAKLDEWVQVAPFQAIHAHVSKPMQALYGRMTSRGDVLTEDGWLLAGGQCAAPPKPVDEA
jgi:hypothetical protein